MFEHLSQMADPLKCKNPEPRNGRDGKPKLITTRHGSARLTSAPCLQDIGSYEIIQCLDNFVLAKPHLSKWSNDSDGLVHDKVGARRQVHVPMHANAWCSPILRHGALNTKKKGFPPEWKPLPQREDGTLVSMVPILGLLKP